MYRLARGLAGGTASCRPGLGNTDSMVVASLIYRRIPGRCSTTAPNSSVTGSTIATNLSRSIVDFDAGRCEKWRIRFASFGMDIDMASAGVFRRTQPSSTTCAPRAGTLRHSADRPIQAQWFAVPAHTTIARRNHLRQRGRLNGWGAPQPPHAGAAESVYLLDDADDRTDGSAPLASGSDALPVVTTDADAPCPRATPDN